MHIKELKQSLEYLFKAQITPFIWGHAGIGKSAVLKQYATEKGYKFFPFYLGTQSDLGDILGLASFVKDKNGSEIATTFATPLWLKDTIDYCNDNPESGAIIFLDEFNRARRDILNGMFSLALDKTFHTLKLPTNCHIVAAGNPPTDEYMTTDINETALMARFAHIKLEPTFNEWAVYAKDANFEGTILSFLQEQPQLLEDGRSNFTLPVKVDRRSYERLDRLFKVGTPEHLMDQLMTGIIGVERLVAYKNHLANCDRPLSAKQVFEGEEMERIKQWSDPNDIKASLLTATSDNILEAFVSTLGAIPDKHLSNCTTYLEVVPKEVAYALLMKLMKSDCENFKSFSAKGAKYEDRLVAIAMEAKGKK